MQRISVHISDEIRSRIDLIARAKSKASSQVIREAIDEGLKVIYPKTSSAQALLDFAKMAEQIPTKGEIPADAIKNMDYYTWAGKKRE